MRTIWKFPLDIKMENQIDAPQDAKIIHIGLDPGAQLCVWMEVNPHNPKRILPIYTVGTGQPMEPHHKYFIGTVVLGMFVWHFYTPYECKV